MKIQNPIRSRIDSILKLTNLSSNDVDYPVSINVFREIKFDISLTPEAYKLFEQAYNELDLTEKQLRVIEELAGAIANLEKSKHVEIEHIAEAIQYRPLK